MVIAYKFTPEKMYEAVHEIIRMAFPGSTLVKADNHLEADVSIVIDMEEKQNNLLLSGFIKEAQLVTTLNREYCLLNTDEKNNEINRNMRRFSFELLSRHQNKPISVYGILTGVRPVKLLQRLIDENKDREAIISILEKEFYLQPQKVLLLTEVAFNNRKYLLTTEKAVKTVSIYIGIPYCPTRCYYCSFPGAVLKNYEKDIRPFLEVLWAEIKIIGMYLKANDYKVQTIYIGGGTPTVLSDEDTAKLLDVINEYLKSDNTQEITVEAGRPDTLSLTKFKLFQEGGVNRVCINPQTMNNKTLAIIGRKHTEKEVIKSVEFARQAGIRQINMDIIVGLPGEGQTEFTYTAKSLLKLEPENLTVHTLAFKRGSIMADNEGRTNIEMRIKNVEEGVKYFIEVLRARDYVPYYLYRQKYMRGDMENTGFSQPGNFCLYNIQMIEERQTIIGLGGGSASKFINLANGTLTSIYNPKDPKTYLAAMEQLAKRKVDKLRGLN